MGKTWHDKWLEYLADPRITHEARNAALSVYERSKEILKPAKEWLPITGIGDDGGLLLVWNSAYQYLQAEISAVGKIEWSHCSAVEVCDG